MTLPLDDTLNGHLQRLARPDEHDHLLAARERRIEQFPIEHRILALVNGDDDERIFASLTAMDRHGISVNELLK